MKKKEPADQEAPGAKRNRQKQEREAAKAAKLAAREAARQDKEETYVMRKNTVMKVLRVLIWDMLGFLFLKGVMVSVRPDPAAEVNKTIADFKAELAAYQDDTSERGRSLCGGLRRRVFYLFGG